MSKKNKTRDSAESQIKRLRVSVLDPNLGEGGKWDEICSTQLAIIYADDDGIKVKGNIQNPFLMEWFIRALAAQMKEAKGMYSQIVGSTILESLDNLTKSMEKITQGEEGDDKFG